MTRIANKDSERPRRLAREGKKISPIADEDLHDKRKANQRKPDSRRKTLQE